MPAVRGHVEPPDGRRLTGTVDVRYTAGAGTWSGEFDMPPGCDGAELRAPGCVPRLSDGRGLRVAGFQVHDGVALFVAADPPPGVRGL